MLGINDNGALMAFRKDTLTLTTNQGEYVCEFQISKDRKTYVASIPGAAIMLTYNNKKEGVSRTIKVYAKEKLSLLCVKNKLCFMEAPGDAFLYKTFRDASAAVFFRWEERGMFAGFENPFTKASFYGEEAEVFFEPLLNLEKGESYLCDANFFGFYQLSGELVEQKLPVTPIIENGECMTRYHNPHGHIPLDRNEIRGFGAYVEEYLELSIKEFRFIFYTYFCPLPQQPSTEEEEKIYREYIDRFCELGGDTIIFNPLQRQGVPATSGGGFWEVAAPGSRAEKILAYSKSRGLKTGIYMGSAQGNVDYCNSPMNPFADNNEFSSGKKISKTGERSKENCTASDDFTDWFIEVQINTIRKYGLEVWNWDPGPGNGSFCYSTTHGHLEGKGVYKGFRNALRIIKRIREAFPDIFLMSFHGLKEYGVWGYRYIDQHEAYWEQDPYFFATMHPDISDDRITADGMRFQSCWDYYFRFLPVSMNHSIAHRMTQSCDSSQLYRQLFDYTGYKYALMSALAAGSSVTVPTLSEYIAGEEEESYIRFYKKWITWAKINFDASEKCYPFGAQVEAGGIDGWSKVRVNQGYIFLCNPAPVTSRINFQLGKDAGIMKPGRYCLKQLYPMKNVMFFDFEHLRTEFFIDDDITVEVPGYEVLLFEFTPVMGANERQLYNIAGGIQLSKDTISITDSVGIENYSTVAAVRVSGGMDTLKINKVEVNGARTGFTRHNDLICFPVQYGENKFPWLLFTGETRREPVNFFASKELEKLLRLHKVSEEYNRITAELSRDFRGFPWARPDKLYFVCVFVQGNKAGAVKCSLNGGMWRSMRKQRYYNLKYIPTEFCACYIELEHVLWDRENNLSISIENDDELNFAGGFLLYPSPPPTQSVSFRKCQEVITSVRRKQINKRAKSSFCIKEAWISTDYIEEYKSFELYVRADRSAEELKGVYTTCPISIDGASFGMMNSDRALQYDPADGLWKAEFKTGSRRQLIIDEEYVNIWAVDKENCVSEYIKVELIWKL